MISITRYEKHPKENGYYGIDFTYSRPLSEYMKEDLEDPDFEPDSPEELLTLQGAKGEAMEFFTYDDLMVDREFAALLWPILKHYAETGTVPDKEAL